MNRFDILSRIAKQNKCEMETQTKAQLGAAGPNKVASRQPRTSDGKFIKFGGFAFSKRNQHKPAGQSKNKFSSYVGKRLNGKALNRADYKTTVNRFRAIWQARQRRNIDESSHGAGGLAAQVNGVFGTRRSRKKEVQMAFKAVSDLRWQLVASTPYGPDKDGQWVTERALKTFAEANPDGGPKLVWWHLYDNIAQKGIVLGQADHVYYKDDALCMEGAFINKEVGEDLAAHTDLLGTSIGFTYPGPSLIGGKEFTVANIYEVSLLPRERASNPYTKVEIGVEHGDQI